MLQDVLNCDPAELLIFNLNADIDQHALRIYPSTDLTSEIFRHSYNHARERVHLLRDLRENPHRLPDLNEMIPVIRRNLNMIGTFRGSVLFDLLEYPPDLRTLTSFGPRTMDQLLDPRFLINFSIKHLSHQQELVASRGRWCQISASDLLPLEGTIRKIRSKAVTFNSQWVMMWLENFFSTDENQQELRL